jgi:HD-GYP domain-containing protein (c-di-GMP phosphodiesterase class II)
MSSDPPNGARSRAPDADLPESGETDVDAALPRLVKARGAPLLEALESHLPGARRHADGTASYAFAAAAWLSLKREHCELVRETARLHDIGKLYVPAELLQRDPGELSATERDLVVSHFDATARLARGAGLPQVIGRWLLAVRERFDGLGPDRLAGEHIPVESRIIRVACAYDALTSDSAFGDSLAERCQVAKAALQGTAGAELDPRVVDALMHAVDASAAD